MANFPTLAGLLNDRDRGQRFPEEDRCEEDRKNRKEMNPEHIDPLYLSAIECVEEAVINALVAGEDVETFKPKGQICRALNLKELKKYF